MSDQNRLVLAYSGGLDTSVAISYLKERTGKDVVAVSLDVGQGGESLETIKQRALACGAVEAYVVDARDEFANEYCMKALKANAMYEGVYPLVSAISRPLISKHLVRAAHQFGADTISHGCTGKGNDQVRFEVSIASIDPTLKAISPIRDLSLTRDVEIAFAKEHKLPIVQTEKSPFSIDQNVWGRAIETGFLEDPWNGPTRTATPTPTIRRSHRSRMRVVIEFKQGVPVKIDGHDVTPLQAIEEMNRRAGAQGIGRIDLIEDRLVGIKSRELYEAPGAVALITAHQELENCCLRTPRAAPHQARHRQALGGTGLRCAVVLPGDPVPERFHRRHPEVRLRRDSHGSARWPRRRDRPSLRQLAVRLQPGHLRFRRQLRPEVLQRLHRHLRPAVPVAAARDVKFGNGIEVPENTVE